MNCRRHLCSKLILAGTLTFPADVFAHSLSKRFGDFYGGLLHPITSLEIGLGFLGVALVVGQQGKAGARSMLGWFLVALFGGAVAASWLPTLESEIRITGLIATALLGISAAAALRFPAPLLALFGLLPGALYGLGNGLAMTTQTTGHLFVSGVLAGGLLAVTPAAAFVTTLHRRWQQTAIRVVGSWIAASGLLVISFHLRGLSIGMTAP